MSNVQCVDWEILLSVSVSVSVSLPPGTVLHHASQGNIVGAFCGVCVYVPVLSDLKTSDHIIHSFFVHVERCFSCQPITSDPVCQSSHYFE